MRQLLMISVLILFAGQVLAAGNSVVYKVGDSEFEGYFVSPGAQAPLVLLLHDWDGLTDYEVKRAEMLAEAGYAVFAADLFGKGVRPTEVVDKRQHTGELYKDRVKMRALILGAVETAAGLGANINNAVAMGYCFGGAAILEYVRAGGDMKGFVTFHGGLKTPEGQDYSAAKGNLLILHGTADANITMDDFADLAIALESRGISHEMIAYGGAPHAFTVYGDKRYNEEADRKSWQRFLTYLEETLRGL